MIIENIDVSRLIPSRENLATLLNDLNKGICIGCRGQATRTNNTLCQQCWNDAEGENREDL